MTNILIKNFADLCFGSYHMIAKEESIIHNFQFITGGLTFFICGYAFAFGSGSSFIGYTNFVLIDLESSKYAFFFFQVRTLPSFV